MFVRQLLMLSCLFVLASSAMGATVTDLSGHSAFSATVDNGAKTILITETIISREARLLVTFTVDEVIAGGIWEMTRTVTNGTGEAWNFFDLELKVPCVVDGNTYQCASGEFVQSVGFDVVSWDEGDPGRTETSTSFTTLTPFESNLDGLRFSGGTVVPNGTDTQVNDFNSAGIGCPSDPLNCVTDVRVIERPALPEPSCYTSVDTTYDFEDISSTGNVIIYSGATTFARFGFQIPIFDWMMYDSVDLRSRHGFLDLLTGSTNGTNVNLTTTAPSGGDNTAIAAMWNNWNLNGSASGDVRQQQFGTAPNRYYIIQWTNVCSASGAGCTDPVTNENQLATFQIKLFEVDFSIEVHFKDADQCNSSTVGIRDVGSHQACTTDTSPSPCEFLCVTDGFPAGCGRVEQWSFNTAFSDETAMRFTRVQCPADDFGWTHRP